MERRWTLGHPDVEIYRRFDAPTGPHRLSPSEATALASEWLARQPHVMTEVHDAVAPRCFRDLAGAVDERRQHVVRALESAFLEGELVAFRVPVRFPLRKIEKAEENVLGPQPIVEETPEDVTWLAIELVDDSDPPLPVPYEAYEVQLADGSVLKGALDGDGVARLDGIVRGPAKVRFPNLAAAAWSQAR